MSGFSFGGANDMYASHNYDEGNKSSQSAPTLVYKGWNHDKTSWNTLVDRDSNDRYIRGFWLDAWNWYTSIQDQITVVVDIAAGEPGSEVIIYPDLLLNVDKGYLGFKPCYLPLCLPTHKRIAWRFASNKDQNDDSGLRMGLALRPLFTNTHDYPVGCVRAEDLGLDLNSPYWRGTGGFNSTNSVMDSALWIGECSFRWNYMRLTVATEGSASATPWTFYEVGYGKNRDGSDIHWFHTEWTSMEVDEYSDSMAHYLFPVCIPQDSQIWARQQSSATSTWQSDSRVSVQGFG